MKKKNLFKYILATALVFLTNFGYVSASVFLPQTLIALYGMQPIDDETSRSLEQQLLFRIFLFLFLMASLITGLVVFFNRKLKKKNDK